MANEFQPRVKGVALPDGVSLFLDSGRVFEGWKNINITKSIESIANSFSLSYDNKFDHFDTEWPIKPGVKVKINIGQERVITGIVDKLDVSLDAEQRTMQVAGRSLPGDLVDCSVDETLELTDGITILQLAEALVKPYNLKVFTSVEDQELPDKFALKPAETVFTALDRAARIAGFFWVSTRDGNIRLTRAARARAASAIHEDVNMLNGSISFDDSERYSTIKVLGQRRGNDEWNGVKASGPQGQATDNGVTRTRPLVKIAESPVDSEQAQTAAEWEASVRVAQGMTVTVTVQGWRQQDGSLWGINQLIRVKSKALGIDTDLLSTNVEHVKSSSAGTITRISLVRKDAYQPKPAFEAEDDLASILGF